MTSDTRRGLQVVALFALIGLSSLAAAPEEGSSELPEVRYYSLER